MIRENQVVAAEVLPIKSSVSYPDEQPVSVSVKIIAAKSAAAYLLITLPPPDFPLSYHTLPEFVNKTKKARRSLRAFCVATIK